MGEAHGPDGKLLFDSEHHPVYEQVPITFELNHDGSQESVSDWIERRYGIFEGHAREIYNETFVGPHAKVQLTDEQARYLSGRLTQWNIKLDLMRLSAGAQTPQHVTSLAMDALNLADSVDSALSVSDELGRNTGVRPAAR